MHRSAARYCCEFHCVYYERLRSFPLAETLHCQNRLLLEELANLTVKSECVSRVVRIDASVLCVEPTLTAQSPAATAHFTPTPAHRTISSLPLQAKLYDQYMNFVCLDSRLFSLALPRTYVQLNDPAATEQQIEATITEVVNGLFSVLVTLGVVPIIRSPKGGAAQMVASQLDARIRDHLVRSGGLATRCRSTHARPQTSSTQKCAPPP